MSVAYLVHSDREGEMFVWLMSCLTALSGVLVGEGYNHDPVSITKIVTTAVSSCFIYR